MQVGLDSPRLLPVGQLLSTTSTEYCKIKLSLPDSSLPLAVSSSHGSISSQAAVHSTYCIPRLFPKLLFANNLNRKSERPAARRGRANLNCQPEPRRPGRPAATGGRRSLPARSQWEMSSRGTDPAGSWQLAVCAPAAYRDYKVTLTASTLHHAGP